MSIDCPRLVLLSKRMTIFPQINNEKLTIFHSISKKFPVEGLRTPVQPFHHGFRDVLIDMWCGPLSPLHPPRSFKSLPVCPRKREQGKLCYATVAYWKDVTTLMSKCNRGIQMLHLCPMTTTYRKKFKKLFSYDTNKHQKMISTTDSTVFNKVVC